MYNIAVFISGNGSNLQSIQDAIVRGDIPAKISLVYSNNNDAYGLIRAKNFGIHTESFSHKNFKTRQEHEDALINILSQMNIDLVVLAGYMRILSPYFLSKIKPKVINIHPSLLPEFKGVKAWEQALNAGAKITGCTVHLVDDTLDGGAIIAQESVIIADGDTADSLHEKIQKLEHKLYPSVVKAFAEGRVKFKEGKVWINGKG